MVTRRNQIDPGYLNTEGSIQRGWTWGNNVVTLDNPDMACGHDGAPHAVSSHAPIVAGNIVSVNYSAETIFEDLGRPWTFGHPYGSMMAYLAACPDEGCESVDINAPIWLVAVTIIPCSGEAS
jgi:lytic cellulose monooxygenase (C1-hydroxylating)